MSNPTTGKRILLLSDNEYLLKRFKELDAKSLFAPHTITYGYSYYNKALGVTLAQTGEQFIPVNTKKQVDEIVEGYDMLLSLHCKQLFPEALVKGIKCINIHPGLNPHNRGWFPQVFSIINGLPAGATIHEIDEELDHGAIIAQKEVKISSTDTSLTAYNKILEAELELIAKHLPAVFNGEYATTIPAEGNLNLKADYDKLCQLDLSQVGTLESHINLLRALTHGSYKNAYFIDKDGNKIFVSVELVAAKD